MEMVSKFYLSLLQIVRELAGYSMGRSDLVRRAMSKKKHAVMEEERKNFIYGIVDEDGNIEVPGCVRNGIDEKAANRIYDSMMDFASYAFNKSHAAAYAVVGYQTAYLMKYYPKEYIAAMLNSIMGVNDKVSFYIGFANKLGIKVLSPDINESYGKFTVENEAIRFGMAAIKNVGVNVINSIVESRKKKGKFKSFMEFCTNINTSAINKRAIESLIKCGAFDNMKVHRSQLLAVYEKILDGISNTNKRNIDGQISLFETIEKTNNNLGIEYPKIKEFEKKYLLAMEKDMSGVYITGHPLEEYEEILGNLVNTNISDIIGDKPLENEDDVVNQVFKVSDGDRVIIGGLICEVNRKITKTNQYMAFIKLQDMYNSVEVIIFPKTLQKYNLLINEDAIVIIKGRVSIREEEEPKIICEDISPVIKSRTEEIYLLVEEENQVHSILEEMRSTLIKYRGHMPIYICTRKERKKYRVETGLWVDGSDEILTYLRNKFGADNIKVQ
ncbi:MAG: OB-fold nucleic acid binding domain-containing protein [Clostridium sp.]